MSNPVLKFLHFDVVNASFDFLKVLDLSQRPSSSKMIVFFLEFGRVQAEQGALDREEILED